MRSVFPFCLRLNHSIFLFQIQEFYRICKSVLLQISDIDNIHVDYSIKSLFFQQIFPFKYKR